MIIILFFCCITTIIKEKVLRVQSFILNLKDQNLIAITSIDIAIEINTVLYHDIIIMFFSLTVSSENNQHNINKGYD